MVSISGMDGGETMRLYNYASIKFIGPISLCYILSIVFFIIALFNKKARIQIPELLFVFKILLFLAISGDVIGILGFCFKSGYYLPDFIKYNIYIWMSIILLYDILVFVNNEMIRRIYFVSAPMLCGAIIASVLGYFCGVRTTYGILEIPLMSDVCYFGFLTLFALFYSKRHKIFIVIAIMGYFYLNMLAMTGKAVIMVAIALIYIIYLIFFDSNFKQHNKKYLFPIKSFVISGLVGIAIEIPILMADTTSLTGIKINAALSIFSGDIGDVSNSPATRIAEIANFYYNNRNNIFHLLFGNGYGGYFTDELGLLNGLDLRGGWSEDVIRTGRFSSAHDTFSVVPLLNGTVGFLLLMVIGYKFFKKVNRNYLYFAVVPWIIFTFYFNPLYAFCTLFFLTGAQYKSV